MVTPICFISWKGCLIILDQLVGQEAENWLPQRCKEAEHVDPLSFSFRPSGPCSVESGSSILRPPWGSAKHSHRQAHRISVSLSMDRVLSWRVFSLFGGLQELEKTLERVPSSPSESYA